MPVSLADDPRIYVRLYDSVRQSIYKGILTPGEPTPSIAVLCRQFTCNRQTASKALAMLCDDGLLVRYPGLGYYVARDVPGVA